MVCTLVASVISSNMSDRHRIVRLNKRNRCVLLYHKAQATARVETICEQRQMQS